MSLPNLRKYITGWKKDKSPSTIQELFKKFQELLDYNSRALELMADMGDKLSGDYLFDKHYIQSVVLELEEVIYKIVYNLNVITQRKYVRLFDALEKAKEEIHQELNARFAIPHGEYVYPLRSLNKEMADYVGEKMATLGELKNRLSLSVPEGFVISTYAYERFIDDNGLRGWIDSFMKAGTLENTEELRKKSQDLRERILQARIPRDLKRAIRKALAASSSKESPGIGWAVRSSAVGEDTQLSYAGQYQTLLNVPSSDILSGYKEVIASLFSPQVLSYRTKSRGDQRELAMAVGCTQMLNPKVSGVIYSTDPRQVEREQMVISACWGLGKLAVEGEAEVDQYLGSKTPPYGLLHQQIGKKEVHYVLSEEGGIILKPVPPSLQNEPCLNPSTLARLIQAAERVEQHMKSFQDIEWSLDQQGQLIFLQARPLRVSWDLHFDKSKISTSVKDHPVLLDGMGEVASRGIGAGKVFVVQSEEEVDRFPRGSVLVLKHTTPRMSKLVPLASAIVTDIGSVAGHLATVSREFRIPTIVGTRHATEVLRTGLEVTVDAEENVVYEGIVKELITAHLSEKTPYDETYEFRLLRRLLKRTSTLHLSDPQSKDFTAAHCTTYHDIVRFSHEMAVQRIAEGISPSQLGSKTASKKLKLPIPLDLLLVDIGGGLKEEATERIISPDDLECEPLRILLEVLVAPGVWQSQPIDLDMKGFLSSLSFTETYSSRSIKGNLAIISKEYLNLSLRLGYHFNMIDVTMSENQEQNYIYFRFFGGVTEMTRRSRRAKLLAQIMTRNDFAVETKGDLIIARIKKVSRDIMEEKLRLVGRLVGFTRQLDVLLRSDGDIRFFEGQFRERKETDIPVSPPM
jgi:pyruvate, water dikinase